MFPNSFVPKKKSKKSKKIKKKNKKKKETKAKFAPPNKNICHIMCIHNK